MKKLILGSLIAALGLTLTSCGSDSENIVEKAAKATKLYNQLLIQDAAQLKAANDKADKVLGDKAEHGKKLKESCDSEELKKLDQNVDCATVELERLVKEKLQFIEADFIKKCPSVELTAKCKTAYDEIQAKLR